MDLNLGKKINAGNRRMGQS